MQVKRRASGFTLIELTVVLLVLVALAGILIPYLSGYLERSHAASSSTNIGEVNKAVQLYNVKYLQGWPNRLDSLLDAPTGGAVPAYVSLDNTRFVADDLDAGQAQALADAGLTESLVMRSAAAITAGASATYDGVVTPLSAIDLSTAGTGKVVRMTDAAAQEEFGSGLNTAAEQYVVFGLGQNSTAVGRVMADAPLHFDQADPKTVYSRFLLVFAIPEAGATTLFKARFVGTLGAEGEGLGTHLSEYYSPDAQ